MTKNRQQAETALSLATIRLKGLAQRLSQLGVSPAAVTKGRLTTLIPVKAPITGIVTQITARPGSYADLQTPLLTIGSTSALYVSLNIFERDLPAIRNGQRVELALTQNEEIRFEGTVARIVPAIDSSTKAITVRVNLIGRPAARLMPGMEVTAVVVTGAEARPALPAEAVTEEKGVPYVFALTKKEKEKGETHYHFRRVRVKTGVTDRGYTEVTPLEPLPENTQLVRTGAFYLSSMVSEHAAHNH